MKRGSALLLCLLSLGFARAAQAEQGGALRRYALIVAANDGGPEREPLQYAERDARAVSTVLEQLGGVETSDVISLAQPSRSALSAAFATLHERVLSAQRGGARTEVVFYYSGHSDETALLFGRERMSYGELRTALDELPVDVRIAILDSCASGAFTRLKGGTRRAPFLLDSSTQVRGHAFLTSSSANEAAQESDRIGGSFFTHYLVSGLRGAADTSGDRKITLTEAYRFAFEETLARTAQTKFGSQHPAYEIRLAGTGDLVMTDLRATSAELVLDESVEGRLFAWSAARTLLLEVYKARGKRLFLALPPGAYRLELSRPPHFYSASVAARAGGSQAIGAASFREVPREETLARGVIEVVEVRPFSASVVPPISTNGRRRRGPIENHLSVSVLYDDPDLLTGLELGLLGVGARARATGLQLATVFTSSGELAGVQASGIANVARTLGTGLQVTLGANSVGETLLGLQLAGAANYAREFAGGQLSFGLNLAASRARGVQGGAVNWARELGGAQLGFVNLARDVRGAQIGGLNVAAGRVRGLQLGIVNYAEEADFSLAALGVTKKGGAHVVLTFSELVLPEIALRLEANYNYSFVSVGFAPLRERAYTLGTGIGGKIPLYAPWLWLDIDVGVHVVQPMLSWRRNVPNSLWQLRFLPRFQLYEHLSLFAGLTLNVQLQTSADEVTPGALRRRDVVRDEDGRLMLWPGFAVGLRL